MRTRQAAFSFEAEGGGIEPPRLIARPFSRRVPSANRLALPQTRTSMTAGGSREFAWRRSVVFGVGDGFDVLFRCRCGRRGSGRFSRRKWLEILRQFLVLRQRVILLLLPRRVAGATTSVDDRLDLHLAVLHELSGDLADQFRWDHEAVRIVSGFTGSICTTN